MHKLKDKTFTTTNIVKLPRKLLGGGLQGTLLGLVEYLIQSNDNTHIVDESMRFRFVDDMTILEQVMIGSWLSDSNLKIHVANDIEVEEHVISTQDLV